MQRKTIITKWILALLSAAIMLQTLFFKFSAAPESVYIFSALGVEPWGRVTSGLVELLASIMLLIPKFRWAGAFIGAATMCGAIASHVFVLGIEINNDGGLLFLYALVVLISCSLLLYLEKSGKNIS